MNSFFKGILVLLVGFFVLVLAVAGCYVTTINGEVATRNRVEAQQQVCESALDKMWKVISQQAEISNEYKDAFKDIYPSLIAGRYGNARGGALLSFIQEANPHFDTSLYKQLMVSVEAQREAFHRDQERLIDLQREHKTILQQFPGAIFLMGRQPVEIQIITSGRTTDAYQTGEDNDVSLFGENGRKSDPVDMPSK